MRLSVDRLSKQYKNKIAVDRVSFTLSEGVTGLLGANGAGKTTLMRMHSLHRPDATGSPLRSTAAPPSPQHTHCT